MHAIFEKINLCTAFFLFFTVVLFKLQVNILQEKSPPTFLADSKLFSEKPDILIYSCSFVNVLQVQVMNYIQTVEMNTLSKFDSLKSAFHGVKMLCQKSLPRVRGNILEQGVVLANAKPVQLILLLVFLVKMAAFCFVVICSL